MDNKQMQPQPGGYTPYGYNPGANAYTPNPPPTGGYPPPNPNAYPQPQPGGYSPYGNGVSISTSLINVALGEADPKLLSPSSSFGVCHN